MVLVDTSIWICALRPAGPPAIQSRLKPLILSGEAVITEWILLELMTGLRKTERKEALLDWLSPVSRLPFHATWWERTWELAAQLRRQGISPSAADCLIATIALENQVPLVHCDADFEAMKRGSPLKTLDWSAHLNTK